MTGHLRALLCLYVSVWVFSLLAFPTVPSSAMVIGDVANVGLSSGRVTPLDMARTLMGSGATVDAESVTIGRTSEVALGTFRNGLSAGIGIESGILLTTGDVQHAAGPNRHSGLGSSNDTPGDADLDRLVAPQVTRDAAVLQFDFTTRAATVTFRFVFSSEEYPENRFNDIFGLFLDGVNLALLPGTANPVSVQTLNQYATPALFVSNNLLSAEIPAPFPLQYDGFSRVLSATAAVTPGERHTLKVAIADAGDAVSLIDIPTADSAVFLAPAVFGRASSVGVYRAGSWFMDANMNFAWDGAGVDTFRTFGLPADIPVTGDWNGSGRTQIGVFRAGNWYLDMNGNGAWDGPVTDRAVVFGMPTDIPVTGDWDGSGTTKIGLYRNGQWILDTNGNGVFDPGTDAAFSFGGLPGDVPVVGDWSGSGTTKIGVFRGGTWALDFDGNGAWGGPSADRLYTFGLPSDKPVTGHWGGGTAAKIGVFRNGAWYLDLNGDGLWNGQATDKCVPSFGLPTDTPVAEEGRGGGNRDRH